MPIFITQVNSQTSTFRCSILGKGLHFLTYDFRNHLFSIWQNKMLLDKYYPTPSWWHCSVVLIIISITCIWIIELFTNDIFLLVGSLHSFIYFFDIRTVISQILSWVTKTSWFVMLGFAFFLPGWLVFFHYFSIRMSLKFLFFKRVVTIVFDGIGLTWQSYLISFSSLKAFIFSYDFLNNTRNNPGAAFLTYSKSSHQSLLYLICAR